MGRSATGAAGRVRLDRRLVLSLAGLATVAGCSRGDPSVESGLQRFPVQERDEVGVIRAELLTGQTYDSSQTAGEVVVYNVWGSWCPPCRKEAPALRRVSRETEAWGVRFIGINVRDNNESARAFERTHRIPYPSITSDAAAGIFAAFGSAFPQAAVPTTLVLDRQQRLAARVIGPVTYPTLRGLVEDAAQHPGAGA